MWEEIFSPRWVAHWREQIRASELHRQGALRWSWSLLLVLQDGPAQEAPADRGVYLDPLHDVLSAVGASWAEEAARAQFVLAGDAEAWREVVAGRLDPVVGVLHGRLELKKGGLLDLAMRTRAIRALLASAGGSGHERFPALVRIGRPGAARELDRAQG